MFVLDLFRKSTYLAALSNPEKGWLVYNIEYASTLFFPRIELRSNEDAVGDQPYVGLSSKTKKNEHRLCEGTLGQES